MCVYICIYTYVCIYTVKLSHPSPFGADKYGHGTAMEVCTVYMCVYMYVCIHTYICTHVCTYMYIYICVYISSQALRSRLPLSLTNMDMALRWRYIHICIVHVRLYIPLRFLCLTSGHVYMFSESLAFDSTREVCMHLFPKVADCPRVPERNKQCFAAHDDVRPNESLDVCVMTVYCTFILSVSDCSLPADLGRSCESAVLSRCVYILHSISASMHYHTYMSCT